MWLKWEYILEKELLHRLPQAEFRIWNTIFCNDALTAGDHSAIL